MTLHSKSDLKYAEVSIFIVSNISYYSMADITKVLLLHHFSIRQLQTHRVVRNSPISLVNVALADPKEAKTNVATLRNHSLVAMSPWMILLQGMDGHLEVAIANVNELL